MTGGPRILIMFIVSQESLFLLKVFALFNNCGENAVSFSADCCCYLALATSAIIIHPVVVSSSYLCVCVCLIPSGPYLADD